MAGRTYQELATEMAQQLFDVLLPAMDRLTWDAGRLDDHRRAGLADTLAHAAEKSPWHAARLSAPGIDLDRAEPGDLGGLPTMTKRDLMANWDAIVTDRRLDLDTARSHLVRLDAGDPALLFDEYHVLTTGGSTGEPGVFCWSPAETLGWAASVIRSTAASGLGPPQRMAFVGARSLRHPSAALAVLFVVLAGGPATTDVIVPIDQPAGAIVARLNEIQPDALFVVCSVLPALVEAAQRGELRIDVDRISLGGDVLDPTVAATAADTFGAPVLEGYATTDVGHIAHQVPGERGLYVNDDLLVVELVDEHERPVEPGEWSDHVLVTSLHSRTLPLIRYRIDDRVRLEAEPGRTHPAFRRIAAVDGRTDDLFHYGDLTVHPHVFRTVLSRHLPIRDFQVHQTPTGADVRVIAAGPLDTCSVATALGQALGRAGLTHPQVTVTRVDELRRTIVGKRLLFIPPRNTHKGTVMTINLSDIPAAVTDYLNTKVTTVISDGTPDSGTLNPGEEATFKITVTNAGAPDGVRLTNVVYHLRIEPTAFGVLKVNPSAAIVTRASLDPAGPLLPRNTFVAEMFVFQIDNTLEVGESHELISEVKGVIEGRAVVTVDVHADIPIESLLPTGENTTPTEQAFRTR